MPWWACGHCKESNTEEVVCLDYNHSLLSDVPNEVFIFERTLEDLYLDSNRITDLPRQLFHCHGLKTLNVSDNELNFIPPAISALENLQSLDLSKNSITTIPETIKSCSHLNYLYLSLNPLERLPDAVTSVVSLVELHLNDVYLEFLPANFGRLVNLKILELRENNLITLPKSMSRLVNLTRLDIGQNEFTELPEVVSSLINLTELWIDTNRIRRLSADIGQLRKLIHFDASNNNLEKLPRDIGYWTKIVEFCVRNNELSEIPSTIGNMKNLTGLKLDNNQIQMLPDSLGKLINLEELMLTHNELKQLPESIGLLRKLQVLSVDENELSTIPTELGSCSSLSILSLRGNKLKFIPAELGHLSELRVLNLVGNQLQNLPVSLLKLGQLAALWLSDNQSKPLVPLQQEYHAELSQMFLTCFMLPQTTQPPITYKCNDEAISGSVIRNGMRHICFAPEAGVLEQPHRLSRAPTPYPKELRALARHARSIQRGISLATTSQQNQENESTMQSPQDPIQIKEAKVTQKPDVTFSIPDKIRTEFYHSSFSEKESGCYNDIKESYTGHSCHLLQNNVYANSDLTYIKDTSENFDTDTRDQHESVVAREYAPPIREAKFIRTYNIPDIEQKSQEYIARTPSYDDDVQTYVNSMKTHQNDVMQTSFYDNNSIVSFIADSNSIDKMKTSFYDNCDGDMKWSLYNDSQFHNQNTTDNFKRSSYSSASDFQTPQPQPPPYHIAAAYSLQAQYFNNLNVRNSEEIDKPVQISSNYDRSQLPAVNRLQNDFSDTNSIKCSIPETQNAYSCSMKHNSIEDQKECEEKSIRDNSDSLTQQNKINPVTEFSDIVEKPPTFTQDKPSVGKNIIAPTPQRPSTFMAKSSSKNSVSRIPSLRTPSPMRNSRSGSPRLGLGLPPSPKSKLTSHNQIQKESRLFDNVCDSVVQKNLVVTESTVINHSHNAQSLDEQGLQNFGSNDNVRDKKEMRSKIPTPQSSPCTDANRKNIHSKLQKPNTDKQMKWMFGLHKNATVVQVALQKNPGLGFSIMEKSNNGIFISKVHPNGPACSILKPGDKILEVDSIDFTKMNQEEAVHVLRNTGPIVTMMISRTS